MACLRTRVRLPPPPNPRFAHDLSVTRPGFDRRISFVALGATPAASKSSLRSRLVADASLLVRSRVQNPDPINTQDATRAFNFTFDKRPYRLRLVSNLRLTELGLDLANQYRSSRGQTGGAGSQRGWTSEDEHDPIAVFWMRAANDN